MICLGCLSVSIVGNIRLSGILVIRMVISKPNLCGFHFISTFTFLAYS